MKIIYTPATGDIVSVLHHGEPNPAYAAIDAPTDFDGRTHLWRVEDGQLVRKPEPSAEAKLTALRRMAWDAAKKRAATQEYAGFEFDGGRYQSDARSQQRIQSVAGAAAIGAVGDVVWTLADNTTRTLTPQAMQQLAGALAAHIQAGHTQAQQTRAAIDAAETEDAVMALAGVVRLPVS